MKLIDRNKDSFTNITWSKAGMSPKSIWVVSLLAPGLRWTKRIWVVVFMLLFCFAIVYVCLQSCITLRARLTTKIMDSVVWPWQWKEKEGLLGKSNFLTNVPISLQSMKLYELSEDIYSLHCILHSHGSVSMTKGSWLIARRRTAPTLKKKGYPWVPRSWQHPSPSDTLVKPSPHLASEIRNCSKTNSRDLYIRKEADGWWCHRIRVAL